MSDLLIDSMEETFDPDSYIRKLCENTKINIRFYEHPRFPVGWRNIVKELIVCIKNHPISITRVNDHFSLLEVNFEIDKPTKEVFVWRAIDKARSDSASTCTVCGEGIRYRSRSNPYELLCSECKKTAGKMGKTQTWLDKY